ncbi:ATP-binding cassette domain-containing protein [Romboutsia sp. 13368]|uniref:ATP-binding cassette domain-containing protein n=1 Tax=Romboutsia sp. 13368 TaxID=2708053 RepID=UPI0025FFBD7A|nr:ABC transporter ATP-binding protein [Romboutsia sp. 13368]
MGIAIKVKNISKSFNDNLILDDISIDFYENKIYGLLGKNGVGKTTLLNIIAKQLICKNGTVDIFGENINKSDDVLDKLCIVREKEFPNRDKSIREIFDIYSYFYKDYDKKLEKYLCTHFEISPDKTYRKLSRGMKSIVSNIIGICSNAPITIFDEPTIGLDADNRQEFYKILLDSYIKNPRTIIISTHLINEVENLIENVVIINKGKVIVDDNIDNISQKSFYISGHKYDLEKLLCLKDKTPDKVFGSNEIYKYYGHINEDDLKLVESLNINIETMNLQDMFVHLTKRGDKCE